MALKWPVKDPDELLDYTLSWAEELTRLNDEIIDSTWRVEGDPALTIVNHGIKSDQHLTYVWLEEGTPEARYGVINTIETAGGRVYERTVQLRVKQR